VQAPSGAADIALFGDGHEVTQLVEAHPNSITCSGSRESRPRRSYPIGIGLLGGGGGSMPG
jgi:hypothetical protein